MKYTFKKRFKPTSHYVILHVKDGRFLAHFPSLFVPTLVVQILTLGVKDLIDILIVRDCYLACLISLRIACGFGILSKHYLKSIIGT